ncbi:MAG: glycosyltransferase [Patescibacteria group bacterium]
MKVLFYSYPQAFQNPGGGEVMLLKTKEALEKQGVYVKLFNQWEDKIKDYDILHIFGSVKDCLGLMESAKSFGIKIVVSPIFWSTFQKCFFEYGSIVDRLRLTAQHLAKVIMPNIPSQRRKIFLLADAIIANSFMERDQVKRLFSIDNKKIAVAHLGVDERFISANPQEFIDKFGIKDFILSVGRIEPRKNNLNLIKALKSSGLKLVIIGDPVSNYMQYYEECKRQADKNTIFINRIDHEDALLASAYAASSVFVLQGWFETPGLVALEAGLSGARLAVTNGGSTKEYFNDCAEYFNPACQKSIRKTIFKALKKEKTNTFKNRIKANYSWDNSAKKTLEVYEHLLK